MTMRVAIVNPVWDPTARTAEDTLRRFPTLTGWANALADAGASVTVHQRFPSATTRDVAGVRYAFVSDDGPPVPDRVWSKVHAIVDSVRAARPQIVHVNGVIFPEWLRALRRALPANVRVVVQDHGGWHPAQASLWSRLWMRRGLAAADAVLVSSSGHAAMWRAARVVPVKVRVLDIMESSVAMRPVERTEAQRRSGIDGDPAILWVGRLTINKDPRTVLDGFRRFHARSPGATLTWVFAEDASDPVLRRALDDEAIAAPHIRMVGTVAHAELPAYYSAADIYVSGSRREGSGYAALEAMACGAVPVLTDIPSFRAMTAEGRVGALWTPGDPASLADAFTRASAEPRAGARERVRARFDETLSWEVIGRQALALYREVCAR